MLLVHKYQKHIADMLLVQTYRLQGRAMSVLKTFAKEKLLLQSNT
jgi:hypothetical protein